MYLTLSISIIIILIVSFLWALFSLEKELEKAKRSKYSHKKEDISDGEIVLFDRTKKD